MTIGIDGYLAIDGGGSQSDPNLSLSGQQADEQVQDQDTDFTVDSVGSSPLNEFTSAGPGGNQTGNWVLFRDGNNDNIAREIILDSSGTFTVQPDFDGGVVAGGDTFQLFSPNGLFSAFDTDQSVRRAQKSRLIFVENEFGNPTMSVYRLFVRPIEPGPLICEVAQGRQQGTLVDVVGIVAEEEEPSITEGSNFIQGIGPNADDERFQRMSTYALALNQSPLSADSLVATGILSTFIKLSFRTGEPLPVPARCVFQVVYSDENGTGNLGSTLIIVDVAGADLSAVLVDKDPALVGPDRALRIGAGARVQVILKDRTTGFAAPGKTVNIKKTSGPGTMTDLLLAVSDESGDPVQAPYFSSTDEADVGMTVSFEVEVN